MCDAFIFILFSIIIINILINILFYTGSKVLEANPDTKRLYDDLLSNYNRLIRPVNNNTNTLTVWLGLKLSQLIEMVYRLLQMLSLIKTIFCNSTLSFYLLFLIYSNDI